MVQSVILPINMAGDADKAKFANSVNGPDFAPFGVYAIPSSVCVLP